jgi:methionyl-tRNA formyltransferase
VANTFRETLRVVFFGTPDFAVPSLAALLDAGVSVPLVVTQPDRPVGRHAEPRPSAVGAFAAERGVPVEKPDTVRGNAALAERLRAERPDALAVVAYGRILPPELLALPRLAPVNVHASLLPRHRGASPIQAAILAGDAETGVATMRMVEALDAGPVYLERRVAIGSRETAGELSARLAPLGGALLVETLRRLAEGPLEPQPQAGEPTYCRTIRREDARADWTLDAAALDRALRAYTPWPGLFTTLGNERVKILEAEPWNGSPASTALPPGTLHRDGNELLVAAGGGSTLRILTLQRAGRGPVGGAEFAAGARLPARFGGERS